MRPAEDIKKLLKKSDVTVSSATDEKILGGALGHLEELKQTQSAVPRLNTWRIIMKNRINKLTTAAAVILIAVLGITILDKSATPAWAIEETIELLARYNGIQFKGILLDEDGKEVAFRAWARANEDQTASNHLRIESETGAIQVVSGNQRFQYDPATATVKITEGYGPAISPWPGPDFFESLQKMVLDWDENYGKDPATNRDRVFVTCSHPAAAEPRSWWFEIDVESKLLVSMKQWDNMSRKGTPRFNVTSLTFFEDLPDNLFEFEIPEGAEIVPALTERNDKLQDPNSGMLLGDMTKEQASREIARRYWQAVIESNWQTVAILYPISTAQEWEDKYIGSKFEEIVEIKEPYQAQGVTIVPCRIRFEGNATRKINTSVMFRTIDSQQSCVITNTWIQDLD